MEDLPERRVARQAEGPAEGIVDEAEPLIGVAAQDHVALVIEQIAIAGFALAHLPLQIFQRFEALIEAIGQSGETRIAGPLAPHGDQRHQDGDTEHQRQERKRDGAAQRDGGDDDQRGGEQAKRRAKPDIAERVGAELGDGSAEPRPQALPAIGCIRALGAPLRAVIFVIHLTPLGLL